MISREEKIQMLGALGDDKLDAALGALGIKCGGSYMDGMDMDAPAEDGLIPWNATEVKVPRSSRPFVDTAQIYDDQTPAYVEPEPVGAQLAPWAAQGV